MALFLSFMYLHFRTVCELALLVKLQETTKLSQPRTIQVYIPPFWLFLGFHPGGPGWNFPYEQTTKLIPLAEPTRLPGSYEDALREIGHNKRWKSVCLSFLHCNAPCPLHWVRNINKTDKIRFNFKNIAWQTWIMTWNVYILKNSILDNYSCVTYQRERLQ